MKVLKFGGSSVANAENINKVIQCVAADKYKGGKIIVVSALGGITDLLLKCCSLAANADKAYVWHLQEARQRHIDTATELLQQSKGSVVAFVSEKFTELENIFSGIFMLGELSERTKDRVVSYGELLSSKIICEAFNVNDLFAQWADSRELIITNSNFGNATVNFKATDANIQNYFAKAPLLTIVPGFIASNEVGITTTLGRGGSDYTAAIFAAALNASSLEIWTDVSGMMTADPRLVINVKAIGTITYHEAMELSHFGAKIIYPPTIQPVMAKGIPVWVKNTFSPHDAGTLIQQSTESGESVTGITSIGNICLLSLEGSGMVGIPGFSKRLFETLAAQKINVILITQSSSEHSICVGINEVDAARAKASIDEAFLQEIESKKVEPLFIENDLSIIALVGDKMKNHTGISGKLFSALGKNGVNVRAISQGSSERNITAVIATADVKKATNVIHEAFFEKTIKEVNLFIAGVGTVGSRLLAQIAQQQPYLLNHRRLRLKVAGIAKSDCFMIDENGIDLNNWKELLANGTKGDIKIFTEAIQQHNLRNTVFADVTASDEVPSCYEGLLKKSAAVVACNKVACSSDLDFYKKLKSLANEYNAKFLFETNVGAGLPVINTITDLIQSGDNIREMEAVLSGTLNFVFNHYDGSRPFAEVVRQAQNEGYTEPDPRLDLSGKDVMRKILILARESGRDLQMEGIANESFMPEACMQGSVEDFYKCLAEHEAHFKTIFDEAHAKGCKLKFVASYKDGKASVGLQHIAPSHDFFHLYGKDNIVLFYTDRYNQQPLVVKGAGAGADVTAAGVFADIVRAAYH